MKNEKPTLKIFCLTQPLYEVEWASLLGDKFRDSLPFKMEWMDDLSAAEVIAWNGLMSPKSIHAYDRVLKRLDEGAILLLMGEARTLHFNHPFVKYAVPSEVKRVEVPGWGILPEELLQALSHCWERIKHV